MRMPLFVRAAACAALSLAFAPWAQAAAPAAAKEPGDLWEVTSKMSMEGLPMAMPAQTHKVCSPKNWSEPPGGSPDKKCETLDFRNTATKSTWKMRCPGPPAMTGEGEITRTSPDAYTGTMKFTSEQGTMTMALSGKRVGDCDAGVVRRDTEAQVAHAEAAQQQAAQTQRDAKAQGCADIANSLNLQQIQMMATVCDAATTKALFCKRLESAEGFATVCRPEMNPPTSLEEAAAYCGKDPESIRKPLCEEALKNETLDFLGKCCPAQSQALAQRECAGRNYTAMQGSKYRGFCLGYASETMTDTQKDAAKEAGQEPKKKKGFKIPWPH